MTIKAKKIKCSDSASKEYLDYLSLYDAGRFAEADIKLEEAVHAKDPLALHTYGYRGEEHNPPRTEEALKFYRLAAKCGYEPSIMNLARHYEDAGDARWYFYWLKKAAALGSPEAKKEMSRPFPYLVSKALAHLEGGGDVDSVLAKFKIAARHGNSDAMVNLANIYDLKFSPPRKRLARRLYKDAIKKNNAMAAYNLAQHYADLGDKENYRKYHQLSKKMGIKKS